MICSVCIATFKRPALLKDLLTSLVNQNLPGDIQLEVVVVDNDFAGSAEEIVQEFSNSGALAVDYSVQHEKNISLTRNQTIERATGEYILFIDDDEVASPNWVVEHIQTIRGFDVDAVFGRVIPIFNDQTPEWMKKSYLFNRPHCPTGNQVSLTSTANCVIKASLLKDEPGPFDIRYGLTGGEDSHLFKRLKQKGARYAYCYEALVSEYIPPQRTRISWMLKRAFRAGTTYTRYTVELTMKRKLIVQLIAIIKGVCFAGISIILMIILFPSKHWRIYWATKVAANLGHILAVFGYFYQGYK